MRPARWPRLLAGALFFVAVVVGPGQARPIKQVARLSVNLSQEFREAAKLSRARGEAMLAGLCAKPGFEELWAFLPAKGLWLELGCCEKATEAGNYVGLDRYIFRLMAENDRIAVYHIHPKTHFLADNYHPARILIKTVQEALPSRPDMATMALFSRAWQKARPGARFTWHIVSRHGVTSYGLTGPALAARQQPSFNRFAFSPVDEEELGPDDLPSNPAAPGEEVRRLIGRAMQNLSGPGYFVRFRPAP